MLPQDAKDFPGSPAKKWALLDKIGRREVLNLVRQDTPPADAVHLVYIVETCLKRRRQEWKNK